MTLNENWQVLDCVDGSIYRGGPCRSTTSWNPRRRQQGLGGEIEHLEIEL